MALRTANRQKFIEHVKTGDSVCIDYGATRVLECWGDDVPVGKQTDFRKAVQAQDDETVVFSWIEWPDKATRDAGMKRMMEDPDPRVDPAKNPMPFDGKRLVYGGFAPVVELVALRSLARSRGTSAISARPDGKPQRRRPAYRREDWQRAGAGKRGAQ